MNDSMQCQKMLETYEDPAGESRPRCCIHFDGPEGPDSEADEGCLLILTGPTWREVDRRTTLWLQTRHEPQSTVAQLLNIRGGLKPEEGPEKNYYHRQCFTRYTVTYDITLHRTVDNLQPKQGLTLSSCGRIVLDSRTVQDASSVLKGFDPEKSDREMRKMFRKINIDKGRSKNAMFDDQGRLLADGSDPCDCLDKDCPGCFFSCSKCSSNKCGHDCRRNRKYVYDKVDIESCNGLGRPSPSAAPVAYSGKGKTITGRSHHSHSVPKRENSSVSSGQKGSGSLSSGQKGEQKEGNGSIDVEIE